MTLLDQRHILVGRADATAEDVQAAWNAHSSRGFPNRDYALTPIPGEVTVAAYVNHGRWVADCPACNGGIACWPDNPVCMCLDCGRTFTAAFPSKADVKKAVALLSERPTTARNWMPQRESVSDLRAENAVNGSRWA